jgi:hypothetical protein
MPSIAIYADSGMGKTMLMERFKRAHPAIYNAAERRLVTPVLALQMASHATERRFFGQLLTAIGVPFVPRATILDLETQALRSLKRMDVKLLDAGRGPQHPRRQREGTTDPAQHPSLSEQ